MGCHLLRICSVINFKEAIFGCLEEVYRAPHFLLPKRENICAFQSPVCPGLSKMKDLLALRGLQVSLKYLVFPSLGCVSIPEVNLPMMDTEHQLAAQTGLWECW